MRHAAIDTGSYSVRLLVADVTDGQFAVVEKQILPTRLLEGIAADGSLTRVAIDRTADAIIALFDRAHELGVEEPRVFGTSAVRSAPNRDALLDRLRAEKDIDMIVLSGEDEARWAYYAASGTGATRESERRGVIDIGGGSTELITGVGSSYERANSTKIGAVRLKQMLPEGADHRAQLALASKLMEPAVKELAPSPESWVGVGGSITTLCAMQLGLTEYDPERVQGTYVPLSAARDWLTRLDAMTFEERCRVPGLPVRRADIITHGLSILVATLELARADGLFISDRDNLYTGIMAKL